MKLKYIIDKEKIKQAGKYFPISLSDLKKQLNDIEGYKYSDRYWKKSIKQICEHLGVKLLLKNVGEIKCGGYYSKKNNTIWLDISMGKSWIKKVFCHELAHYFQYKCLPKNYRFTWLSEKVVFERQADKFGYIIYKKYIGQPNRHMFNTYKTIKDIIWLTEYYSKDPFIIQDIVKE